MEGEECVSGTVGWPYRCGVGLIRADADGLSALASSCRKQAGAASASAARPSPVLGQTYTKDDYLRNRANDDVNDDE